MKENIIYTSSKYDDFTFKAENRSIDEKNVEKIAANMKERGWVGVPIEVSEQKGKLVIENGQHRFTAAKRLNIPVRFMLVPPRKAYQEAEQNSLVKKWKMSDYVETYANGGAMSYKRLKNLIEEFPQFTAIELLRVVSRGDGDSFRKGRFTFNEEEYFMARNILTDLAQIKNSITKLGISQRAYTRVLYTLLKINALDVDRIMEKIEKYGEIILKPVATNKAALECIDTLYNYRVNKNNVVYLTGTYKTATR